MRASDIRIGTRVDAGFAPLVVPTLLVSVHSLTGWVRRSGSTLQPAAEATA